MAVFIVTKKPTATKRLRENIDFSVSEMCTFCRKLGDLNYDASPPKKGS